MSAHGIVLKDDVYAAIRNEAIKAYEEGLTELSGIAMRMMDVEGVPIHYPYHHFIVPASYLIAACVETGKEREEFIEMLDEAKERSLSVQGGFCGNYGACGAGVGAGIFMSVYTDGSPMAVEPWQWANEVTGIALQGISKCPGPRCCKRVSFLSFSSAVPYINEKLGLHMKINNDIVCKYYEQNNECKRNACPFYKAEV